MTRKLIAIFTALLLTASICACSDKGNNNTKETTGNDATVNITDTKESESENGSEGNESVDTPDAPTEIGDPGEYDYTECDETVYINNPGSAVTLRTAEYEAKGSLEHGTELKRIGLSTDAANYWSKVTYEGETYYVASKFITKMKNPDEGFVEVTKTVYISEKTGSLNIRNIPSMESTIIGHVAYGEAIKVIAENTDTEWYKIEFVAVDGTTKTGYIASDAKYYEADTTETEGEAATEAATATGDEA